MDKPDVLDIGSKSDNWIASELSNFTPHTFVIDEVICNSMEGFLQSLKFEDLVKQQDVCLLTGFQAKFAGRRVNWQSSGTLWWKGKPIKRISREYTELLDRAFEAMFKVEKFRLALKASKGLMLAHSLGKRDPKITVLTEWEFVDILNRLRSKTA